MTFYDVFCERNRDNLDKPSACQMMRDGTLRTVSYGEMFEGIDRYYDILAATGDFKPGDRIGICGAPSPEWHMAFFAIAKMGCTAACIDHTYQQAEMEKTIHKAKLRGLYLTDDTNAVIKDELTGVNIYSLENGLQRQLSPRQEASLISTEGSDVLIFSSGTTSTAAGILHTAENAVKSITMILHANYVDNNKQRFMAFLPNSHIYGCYAQCIAPSLFGTSVCYLEELSGPCILAAFKAYSPTIFCGVPKVYELLMGNITRQIEGSKVSKALFNALFPLCLKLRQTTGINIGQFIFSAVKKGLGGGADVMLCGGAPLKKETCEFLFGVGLRPIITYGATETSIPTLGNYGSNLTMSTCGKAYPDIKMRFSDNGELQLITPYQMVGYFDEPERTAEAYTEDGWFRTGDLGTLDEKGNVLIQGRLKENIVLATGKKVAPDDLEKNYADIPGVADYAICGIPCGETGSYDEVHCFVVPSADADPAEVSAAFLERSSNSSLVMKLQDVHIVSSIPRTALGKPKRYQLTKLTNTQRLEKIAKKIEETVEKTIEENVIYAVRKVTGASVFETSAKLFDDLALDSLSSIELIAELEVLTGITVDDSNIKNYTVDDLIRFCKSPPAAPKKKNTIYPLAHGLIDFQIMKLAHNLIKFIYKVKVRGEHHIPRNSGYIICANHVSNFDYLFMTCNFDKSQFDKLGCMAKKELFKDTPINRLLCQVAGMVPIDRQGAAVSNSMGMVSSKLNESWGIVVFPEGTRSHDGSLGELKHGASLLAINNKVPIIPVHIKGGFEAFSRHKPLPSFFNFKTFHRHQVEVDYGEPIYPDDSNHEALTERLREAIQKLSTATD